MNPKKSPESFLLKLALGAALAASAGYAYFTHKEEIDAEGKKRIAQLAKIYRQSKPVVEKRVREIWGTVNKEAIATYLDVRANLLHTLEDENFKKGQQIAQKRYDEIVDMVVKKAQKAGLIKSKQESGIKAVLKTDWNDIVSGLLKKKSKMAPIAKKAREVVEKVKKAEQKAGKTIKKSLKRK